MIRATVVNADELQEINSGKQKPKPGSQTEGQLAASTQVWQEGELQAGVWEITPGTFPSSRDGFHEIAQILEGRATIVEPDGNTFEITPGSLFVTPAGWTGTWTVHEAIRKVWVVLDLPA